MTITDSMKLLANQAGGRFSAGTLAKFGSLFNYIQTGQWMRKHNFLPVRRVRSRAEIINELAARLAGQEILYLEFGVWQGETMKMWSRLLTNPASRLHGFDSFEGLPEAWDDLSTGRIIGKGYFSTGGNIPQIADHRVKFFKGWFSETLPGYEFLPAPQLVLFMDADLYSSTIYVLNFLLPHIKLGTIVYFDEFSDPQHEQRAFSEFMSGTGMKFKALMADYGTTHVAFERVG